MAFVGSSGVVGRKGLLGANACQQRPRPVFESSVGRCRAETKMLVGNTPDDYVVLGLAVCFKTAGAKNLEEMIIIEPLSSSTLENISSRKVPTSYKRVLAIRVKEIPENVSDLPEAFIGSEHAAWGENFMERTEAAARTFKRREVAQKLVDLGTVKEDFQFSTARKRILNETYEPSFADNVKQDISIDVYNRDADELANI